MKKAMIVALAASLTMGSVFTALAVAPTSKAATSQTQPKAKKHEKKAEHKKAGGKHKTKQGGTE